MHLIILSLIIQLFILIRLRKSNVSKSVRFIFALWIIFWLVSSLVAGFDYSHAEYDLLPGRWTELLRAMSVTWSIISIFAFFSLITIDILAWLTGLKLRKLLCAVMLTLAGTLYCAFEAYYVTTRYAVVPTSKLPEGVDRIRIALLTDVHIGGFSTFGYFERVMRLTEEASPDIIVLGGDTIDGNMSYRQRELELLTETAKKARYGAIAINGNHEYYHLLDEDVEQIIRDCGIRMLIFERTELAGIVIISLDDALNGWLKPYVTPEDSSKFVLVLKHRPGLPFDAEGRFDLQLSGHTHGGQFWPLGYFKSRAQDSTQGLSQKAGGYVYVSNGAGFNGVPLRFMAPPEVSIIDIVRE